MRMNREPEQDGWREWSQHILKGLERLDSQMEDLREETSLIKLDITKLGFLNDKINGIEEKILNLKREITEQRVQFQEGIKGIEKDLEVVERTGLTKADDITKRVLDIESLIAFVKVMAGIIGTIILALLGMISFSIKDFFK